MPVKKKPCWYAGKCLFSSGFMFPISFEGDQPKVHSASLSVQHSCLFHVLLKTQKITLASD